jgi:hypothetical protein
MSLVAVTRILAVASAVPAVLFCFVYMSVGWYKTPMGRHMMAFMGVWALILSLTAFVVIFGSPPWLVYLRVVVWMAINLIFWRRLVILLRVRFGKFPAPRCPHCNELLD